jgi:integrase
MAVQTLTDDGIETLQPHSGRYEVFDALTPGLAIRVTPTGHKSWVLLYRHHSRPRRLTLGRYPDRTLEAARAEAIRQRRRILEGADPAMEKRDLRATVGNTIGVLYELYKKTSDRKRSWPEQRRIFEREVLPTWRDVPVRDVTRKDIRALVYAKAEMAPIMANRMLARISRLFTFALELDWIAANPASGIRRPGAERSRDRVLSRDELRELWAVLGIEGTTASPKPYLSRTLNDVLTLMLLTGQRRGEVSRMRWLDVDLRSGWWTIPATSSKNFHAHRVPLTSLAVDVLKRRANAPDRDNCYVFSNQRSTCVGHRSKKAAAVLCKRGVSFHFAHTIFAAR